jgi:biopolymer transport protein ExbB
MRTSFMQVLTKRLSVAVATLAIAFAGTAHAAAEQKAVSLEQLLEQVKNARAQEAKENAARETEFKANRDKQAQMLQTAEHDQATAEAESTKLSNEFDSNDKQINEQTNLLHQRQGNMGELFGVVRQVAGDTANALEESIISAQFPHRAEFLRKLAGSKSLPSISELERLWIEIQSEMTESGRVVRYSGQIVQADGKTGAAVVTRVGPFAASTGDKYLAFRPSLESLEIIPRQPPGSFGSAAENLQDAKEGYVRAVADPGRGVIFGLYGERPNVWERIQKGQFVGYVIITVGVIGAILWLYQLFYLLVARRRVNAQMKDLGRPTNDNPLGRMLLAYKGDGSRIEEDADVAELRLSEAAAGEIPKLENYQPFLRLAVAAGPLLGLIGTVIGMIITFQSITESGSSDPKIMAAGIGQAMIATVLGLGIAIPLLFCNAALASLSKGLVQTLDREGQGMLADSIEARRGA